ncbi:hypothetical protein [Pseudomonas koreensis]|uniref:hypothetical protein n=1 Tax=Pseudomonas koreensis TaxID=198620 RepID=UPI0012489C83|nr:hypothetical protein [Pseudomonas koreensis]KAB0513991.1 hypothetical protein F7R05_12835 [Pseudomonas koreensis]NNA63226.1 hypothetical protein [Pseudomonas koreensis]GGK33361.1 hypothetical protein GCM10009103_30420 [Pseudomonas koreensis]
MDTQIASRLTPTGLLPGTTFANTAKPTVGVSLLAMASAQSGRKPEPTAATNPTARVDSPQTKTTPVVKGFSETSHRTDELQIGSASTPRQTIRSKKNSSKNLRV